MFNQGTSFSSALWPSCIKTYIHAYIHVLQKKVVMPSKKTIVAVGAVLASVSIIGALALRKPKGITDDDEDAFVCASSVSPTKQRLAKPTTTEPVLDAKARLVANTAEPVAKAADVESAGPAATIAVKESASDAMLGTLEDKSASLLDEALDELGISPAQTAENSTAAKLVGPSSMEDRTELSRLGLSMRVPKGWEVHDELSAVPNVAVVTLWNPEFATIPDPEMPGVVPVIILSVEDIRGENLNLTEFKDRSKELSMRQLLMMTGGAIQPMMRKDASVSEGPFRHILEYTQSMPPFFDISVINLLEVQNGIAYVFQIMCKPNVMNEYRPLFMQLARDVILTPMKIGSLGYIRVNTGKVSVNIDTTWLWSYNDANSTSTHLVKFELASSTKKEEILLYETDKLPASSHKVRDEKVVDGATIVSAFDGTQEKKTISYGGYSFVVHPLQKMISYLSEALLVRTIKTVAFSSVEPKTKGGATFISTEYGYCFDIVGDSRVVSTQLGNGVVIYAPLGVPQELTKDSSSEDPGPTATVRVGSPESDPDCMASLEEWRGRMMEEVESGNVSDVRMISMKGVECVTFTSKDMQEVGPNQRIEVRGEVYVFVRDGITTLIRWETSTGMWRKYERQMSAFLDSFTFLESAN